MATRKRDTDTDPTVRTLRGAAPEYPEGTHPPHPPSEQDWGPGRFSYSEMPAEDKPDESTVAQVVEDDPLQVKAQDALRDGAESLAKAEPESAKGTSK
jgi:hypothetical protein